MTQSWREWFGKQAEASTMQVETIPLSDVDGWGMQEGNHFGRPDGKFFRLAGKKISVPKEGQREVPNWMQPLLEETGGQAAVVLVVDAGPVERFLVQVRIKPGNNTPGHAILGATVQASRPNLDQAHGGNRPPRAEFVDGMAEDRWITLPSDGGRYDGKSADYAIVFATPEQIGELRESERWLTRTEIWEAMRAGLANEYLVKALATLAFAS